MRRCLLPLRVQGGETGVGYGGQLPAGKLQGLQELRAQVRPEPWLNHTSEGLPVLSFVLALALNMHPLCTSLKGRGPLSAALLTRG